MNFDEHIALCYGVHEAIMVEVLRNHIAENERNRECFHEGKYWARISIPDLEKEVPYMAKKGTIQRTLISMYKQGVIEKATFKKEYPPKPIPDRTKWYTLTDKANIEAL